MRQFTRILVFLLIASAPAAAQTELTLADTIASARILLKNAFLQNDPAAVQLWIDSLNRLDNPTYSTLPWDERWLLYFWDAAYGNIFEEVAQFSETTKYLEGLKIKNRADSLYEWVDYTLYEDRYAHFSNLNRQFLREEERLFATLLLEYLLRLNADPWEWVDRTNRFMQKYPESPFRPFLETTQSALPQFGNKAITAEIGYTNGNWSDALARTLKPYHGMHLGLGFWHRAVGATYRFSVGSPRIDRTLLESGYAWRKGDRSSCFFNELQLGFNLLNTDKIRVYPSAGLGWAALVSPTTDEEENPLPEYYALFSFSKGYWTAGIQVDVKNRRNHQQPIGRNRSYSGFRIQTGFRQLNWGQKNPALQGNQWSVGISWQFYRHLPSRAATTAPAESAD